MGDAALLGSSDGQRQLKALKGQQRPSNRALLFPSEGELHGYMVNKGLLRDQCAYQFQGCPEGRS